MKKRLTVFLLSLAAGCSGMTVELPVVDQQYDERIKALAPPEGQSIIYLYYRGDTELFDMSSAYINGDGMGNIFTGTYLYTIVDPGKVTIKATRQMRYSDRRMGYPIAYHSAWREFEVLPDQRYFVELRNQFVPSRNDTGYEEKITEKYYLFLTGDSQASAHLESVQLSFSNRFDRVERGYPKHPTFDLCPFGATSSVGSDPVPCTFSKSF